MKKTVICIVGPTAVGKTTVSIALAKRLSTEVINGDAFQVYRSMDIGTAKVRESEMEGIKHHLFSYVNHHDNYDVSQYQRDARHVIDGIHSQGKIPIIVGGTGLYLRAALYDYDFSSDNTSIEAELTRFKSFTDEQLYQELSLVDSEDAKTLHMNNRRRVERSLALYHVTKKTKIERQVAEPLERYSIIWIGLKLDRELLWKRQDQRIHDMLQQGLIDEVRALFGPHYQRDTTASQAIGYKELFPYLLGEESLEQAIEQIKIHTHQFTKRQFTWFTLQMPVHWFDVKVEDITVTINAITQYLAERMAHEIV